MIYCVYNNNRQGEQIVRIWNHSLIPKLCRQHLLAMWREGLGAYSIIVNHKKGYRNHPAVVEFADCPEDLWLVLKMVRDEMLYRGYKPKAMPELRFFCGPRREWQTLEQQVEILRAKQCGCDI